jgi:hypothetical protein
MSAIVWDQVGDRRYEAGVDRCVLYSPVTGVVPWNGIISIDEKVSGSELTPLYFDGTKFGDTMSPGDYAATLRAYTYPDEFLPHEGVVHGGNGIFVTNQQHARFGLSYRTMIGDDVSGLDAGYKIHVLYNLLAVPSQKSHKSLPDPKAMEFTWEITSVPGAIKGYRATAHLIFDTRYMNPLFITDIEETLYGNAVSDAKLPPIASLVNFASNWVIMRITDNLDGTWTATGPDNFISMLSATEFQIIQANAVYLDDDTYMISNLTR